MVLDTACDGPVQSDLITRLEAVELIARAEGVLVFTGDVVLCRPAPQPATLWQICVMLMQ